MDRYLLSGALGLLIFQIFYLLGDLGLLGRYGFQQSSVQNQAPIGRLIQKRQAVKRKAMNSLIWEEPEKNEQLYRYDSVLTLDDSGAELELDGDIKLNVHENTLVVLEPMQNTQKDEFRVRFQRGLLRARNPSQKLSFGSGDWVIEANSGSNLSIRALDNEKLEVEVNEGEVNLQNRETQTSQSYTQGQKLTLDPDEVLKEEQVDKSMSFVEPQLNRIYSHNFPMPVEVRWEGDAKELQILSPNQKEETRSLNSRTSELLFLSPGTYLLTLKNEAMVSPSFTLELKPAPKLKYLHPLPRDRVEIGKEKLFSWFHQTGIEKYQVQFEGPGENEWTTESSGPFTEIQPPLRGRYEWSVEARDTEGYRIPPFYSIPIYFTDSPLAAPKLNTPKKRQPAQDSKTSPPAKDGAWLKKVIDLLIPKANADELRMHREIIFTWFPVTGADFYIIEISDSEDFLKPLVITKTDDEEFSWSGFEEKKYYWRVAAGQNSGRMGLFSEAAEFDVTALKSLRAEDFSANVRYVETPKPTPSPTPTATPTPTPTPKPKLPTQKAKPQVAPPTKYEFSLHLDYLNIDQANVDLDRAQFTGLAGLGLSGKRTWWIGKKLWRTDFDLQALSWKPRDKNSLPFQGELNNFFFDLEISQIKETENRWGLNLLYFPLAERADLEKIETSAVFGAGVFYGMNGTMDEDTRWNSNVYLGHGDGLLLTGWKNELRYTTSRSEKKSQFFGITLDLHFAAGDKEVDSLWSRFGANYGWSW